MFATYRKDQSESDVSVALVFDKLTRMTCGVAANSLGFTISSEDIKTQFSFCFKYTWPHQGCVVTNEHGNSLPSIARRSLGTRIQSGILGNVDMLKESHYLVTQKPGPNT